VANVLDTMQGLHRARLYIQEGANIMKNRMIFVHKRSGLLGNSIIGSSNYCCACVWILQPSWEGLIHTMSEMYRCLAFVTCCDFLGDAEISEIRDWKKRHETVWVESIGECMQCNTVYCFCLLSRAAIIE